MSIMTNQSKLCMYIVPYSTLTSKPLAEAPFARKKIVFLNSFACTRYFESDGVTWLRKSSERRTWKFGISRYLRAHKTFATTSTAAKSIARNISTTFQQPTIRLSKC